MNEVILDTNIFIRFLVKDVSSQLENARRIFEEIEKGKIKGLVSVLVINEIIWILENFYEIERKVYIPKLLTLLSLKYLKIIEVKKGLIAKILQKMQEKKYDFTDIYLSEIQEKRRIFSFDKDLEKLKK